MALQQMRDDEDYGDLAEPALYPLFHEAIAGVEVRNWLGWNRDANTFDNTEELSTFYNLITPSATDDNSPEVTPKIRSYSDVRELKRILPNPDAKRYLVDPDRTFLECLTISRREDLSRKWRTDTSPPKS